MGADAAHITLAQCCESRIDEMQSLQQQDDAKNTNEMEQEGSGMCYIITVNGKSHKRRFKNILFLQYL